MPPVADKLEKIETPRLAIRKQVDFGAVGRPPIDGSSAATGADRVNGLTAGAPTGNGWVGRPPRRYTPPKSGNYTALASVNLKSPVA
jgi:hypothetical protein